MIKIIKKPVKTVALLMAFAATGCASTQALHNNGGTELTNQPVAAMYDIKPGDSLTDIALRLTGEIANWQAIAQRNDIKDPKTLSVGDTLIIPGELLQTPTAATNEANQLSDAKQMQFANTSKTSLPVTTGNGISVARGTRGADEIAANIAMYPVNVNRTFTLEPLNTASTSAGNPSLFGTQAPQIKVVGTYYPKGVYEQPANYARLVSRVSPGTVLQLDNVVNDWYKIVTDNGVGYIRRGDAALIE